MPLAPDIISRPGPLAIPFTYELGVTEQLRAVSAFAKWDGTGASGTFLPCLSFYDGAGNLFMRVFPSQSISAGGTADVTYAPFPGGIAQTAGGGGTRVVPLPLNTPDASSNGYPALTIVNGYTNVRRVVPAFTHGVDGTWEGSLQVPADYASGGTVTLSWGANATTGNLRNRVGSQVVANGVTLDGAYTQETYVSTAVPGTAKRRFQSSFTLSTSLAAGSTLLLQVTRNGSNAADTLAVDALLFGCDLSYTSSY